MSDAVKPVLYVCPKCMAKSPPTNESKSGIHVCLRCDAKIAIPTQWLADFGVIHLIALSVNVFYLVLSIIGLTIVDLTGQVFFAELLLIGLMILNVLVLSHRYPKLKTLAYFSNAFYIVLIIIGLRSNASPAFTVGQAIILSVTLLSIVTFIIGKDDFLVFHKLFHKQKEEKHRISDLEKELRETGESH